MVVHQSEHKGAKNDLIKDELDRTLYVAYESTPKISLQGALKNAQKYIEKDTFHATIDDSLDSAIKGAHVGIPECATRDALIKLHKDAHGGAFEATLLSHLKLHLFGPMFALVDAIVNAQMCTKWLI